jgi:hypothetical protein
LIVQINSPEKAFDPPRGVNPHTREDLLEKIPLGVFDCGPLGTASLWRSVNFDCGGTYPIWGYGGISPHQFPMPDFSQIQSHVPARQKIFNHPLRPRPKFFRQGPVDRLNRHAGENEMVSVVHPRTRICIRAAVRELTPPDRD